MPDREQAIAETPYEITFELAQDIGIVPSPMPPKTKFSFWELITGAAIREDENYSVR